MTARVSAALLLCVVVCFSGPGSQQTPVIVVVKWCCVVIVVIGLYCRLFFSDFIQCRICCDMVIVCTVASIFAGFVDQC